MARGHQQTKVWGYLTGNITPEKRREYLAQRQIASTNDNDIVAFGYGRLLWNDFSHDPRL
jgi:hypothetical protein